MKFYSFLLAALFLCCGEAIQAAEPLECVTPGTTLTYGLYKSNGKLKGFHVLRVLSVEEVEGETIVLQSNEMLDLMMKPMRHPETKQPMAADTARVVLRGGSICAPYSAIVGPSVTELASNPEVLAGLPAGAMLRGEASELTEFVVPAEWEGTVALEPYKSWLEIFDVATGQAYMRQETGLAITLGATESITTDAGTFDCRRVEYLLEGSMSQPGMAPMSEKVTMLERRAPGIGIVQSGPIDKKGEFKDAYESLMKVEAPAVEAAPAEKAPAL